MNLAFSKIIYLFSFLVFFNVLSLNSEEFSENNNNSKGSQILIESTNQRSDLENSIFYAEGDVIITNLEKEFIAKSKKAIFYKLSGKIKLIGEVEVITRDSGIIEAGEIIYFLKENKFEAISGQSKKVNTRFLVNENEIFE